jgi:hypothetical protein
MKEKMKIKSGSILNEMKEIHGIEKMKVDDIIYSN